MQSPTDPKHAPPTPPITGWFSAAFCGLVVSAAAVFVLVLVLSELVPNLAFLWPLSLVFLVAVAALAGGAITTYLRERWDAALPLWIAEAAFVSWVVVKFQPHPAFAVLLVAATGTALLPQYHRHRQRKGENLSEFSFEQKPTIHEADREI